MAIYLPLFSAIGRILQIGLVSLGYGLYQHLPPSALRSMLATLTWLMPSWWSRKRRSQSLTLRTQLAFQELGPIATKLGQMLSTRHDLLSPATAQALAQLQDRMPQFPADEAIAIIERQFEMPLERLFSRFDRAPLAAASIAQVHTAQLHPQVAPDAKAQEVVIKVVRPGIRKLILRETNALMILAQTIDRVWPASRRFYIPAVVADYQATILAECDLRLEAANTRRFRADFEQSDLLYVPKIIDPWVREQVFIMERIYGIPVSDVDRLQALGVNLTQLSEVGATIFLTQVFKNNFFHADMHPGNVLVDASNPQQPRYIALDCAIAGSLSPRDHRLLSRQLIALFNQDFLRLARLLISGNWVPADTNRAQLAIALNQVCSPILAKPLAEIEFGPLLANLFRTAREFELQALPQFVLLEKTLLHVEGLGRQLDPQLDIWTLGKPLLTRWLRSSIFKAETAKNLAQTSAHLLSLAPEAMEDWHDQTLGVRPTHYEALGSRIKNLEFQLSRQVTSSRRKYWAILLASLGLLYWHGFDLPLPTLVCLGLALIVMRPKSN